MTDELLREIEQDIRRERTTALWKKIGPPIAAVALVIVAGAAAFVAWREYQASTMAASGDAYAQALDVARQGDAGGAAAAFLQLEQEAAGGYRDLAALRAATSLAAAGDDAGALSALQRVAATGDSDVVRDIAALRAAVLLLDADLAREAIETLLPLTEPGGSQRLSALEILGAARLRVGDTEGARGAWQQVLDDAAAQPAQRSRVEILLGALAEGS